MLSTKFGGITVRNSRDILNADTKLCQLLLAHGKRGKTTLAASLNNLTMKLYGKPTLFIAVEAGDGGGTEAIQEFGVDYVSPDTHTEFDAILGQLQTDTHYAGVVLDSATELVHRIIKPYALTFPPKEKQPVRTMGVPDRGDYHSMGEFTRQRFNRLMNLTTGDPKYRKHVVVTARLKERYDEQGNLVAINPDLPGAMADTAIGMFQTISRIDAKTKMLPDKTRVSQRTLITRPDAVCALGDRTKVFPEEFVLTNDKGLPVGYVELWEQYWMPRIQASSTTK